MLSRLQALSATQAQYLLDLPDVARTPNRADTGRVYRAVEVDVPVKPIIPAISNSAAVLGSRRGSSGIQLGASGQSSATAEFVVDSTGRILPETVRISETTGDDASRRLTRFLAQSRYEPAVKNGQRVRQVTRSSFALRGEVRQLRIR